MGEIMFKNKFYRYKPVFGHAINSTSPGHDGENGLLEAIVEMAVFDYVKALEYFDTHSERPRFVGKGRINQWDFHTSNMASVDMERWQIGKQYFGDWIEVHKPKPRKRLTRKEVNQLVSELAEEMGIDMEEENGF